MEIFITDKYFGKLEKLYAETNQHKLIRGEAAGLQTLFQMLISLPLNTDIPSEKIAEIARNSAGKKEYDSYKELYLMSALKSQSVNRKQFGETESISNFSAFYFKTNCNTGEITKGNGIAGKGNDFTGDSFYEDCSITDLSIKPGWLPSEKSVPPVNAMLIADPYIFGHPFDKKLNRLTEFVKFYAKKTTISFHLTVLFCLQKNFKCVCTPVQVSKALNELSKIGEIEIQLISSNKEHDRLIFTNYTSGNVGNLFSNSKTVFNQNFLAVGRANKIRLSYETYKRELIGLCSDIEKTPQRIRLQQARWETSKFTNRLFEPIAKL